MRLAFLMPLCALSLDLISVNVPSKALLVLGMPRLGWSWYVQRYGMFLFRLKYALRRVLWVKCVFHVVFSTLRSERNHDHFLLHVFSSSMNVPFSLTVSLLDKANSSRDASNSGFRVKYVRTILC